MGSYCVPSWNGGLTSRFIGASPTLAVLSAIAHKNNETVAVTVGRTVLAAVWQLTTLCLALELWWVEKPSDTIPLALRLSRDPEGRELLLTPSEALKAAKQQSDEEVRSYEAAERQRDEEARAHAAAERRIAEPEAKLKRYQGS